MRRNSILMKGIIINFMMSIIVNAQQGDINFGDLPRPVPSVSSLPTYTETPVSLATGIPDIKFPLFGLPTNDKSVSANLLLQFHQANMGESQAGGEIGLGWTMFAGGTISREIVSGLDEMYDDASWAHYKKNKFDDMYYYNLPGISGKFKIERNISDNTFKVVNLVPNNIKIEYTRNTNNATLIINSFTITDDNGYKYIFNDYSQSRFSKSTLLDGTLYKSAFYLTEIKNAANVQLLSFNYQKDNKIKPGSNLLLYQSCKLKDILSPGLGSITLDYNYDQALENTLNDPYSIAKVSLKNNSGNIVSQYGFKYTMEGYSSMSMNEEVSKRTLIGINKINLLNPAGVPLETTKLFYDYTLYTLLQNGYGLCVTGADLRSYKVHSLSTMVMPTGGMIKYNYEVNESYVNKNYPGYVTPDSFTDISIQHTDLMAEMAINTKQTNNYTFQVTGEPGVLKKIYVYLDAIKYKPVFSTGVDDSFMNYTIDDQVVNDNTCSSYNDPADLEGTTSSLRAFNLYPGTHTLKISGTGGHGDIKFSDIKTIPPPFRNASTSNYKLGARIKDIKYYNSEYTGTLQKTIAYDYNVFNDPLSISGYVFYPEMESISATLYPFVLYKNVKVTDSENNGYVNYYFKTPDAYPKTPYTSNGLSTSFWPYYNLTKSGVMEKKEVFNNQNQLVSATNYDFTFETLDQLPEIFLDGAVTKNAYIKNTKVITKDYTGTNRFIENTVETAFNPANFKAATVKETSSDGNVVEKLVTYSAVGSEYQRLENAFMTGVPVKTEIKNNGKLVSNTLVKYENSDNLYPSSVVTVNPNDSSNKVAVKYDEYDSKGNVKQLTSNYDATAGTGTPSVIIWGYYQNFPIAKIEGAKLSDIGTLADDIILKSNADVDASSESILLNALDNFRTNPALKNFMITTYTYDPLIGATTITPANGLREIYKYDKNGKLTSVVDVNGNIIKDYKYNTKPQL
ncbi:hypothetical protein MP477_03785 [Chryseobacterium sp. WG23]|uniref:hypothetical protein n=1 Tax=Chryseobacterium sp. WG23 TaxID=2926910 RepID=UPI00211EE25F|nr:hypothetical protein [Chryseobacterium sp. WG23]MCQ9634072.1 hypothetical protein [Chryseobacterium sp. WG23]